MGKRKSLMIAAILFLAIGFAAVSTTLIINGTIALGNSDDFKIIFTNAILDDVERKDFISSDKIHIQFESNTLKSIDDETTLEYEVTNTSRNYDADVKVTCSAGENEYIHFAYTPKEMRVEAGKTETGSFTASMFRVVEEDQDIEIECELVATPVERTSLGDEYVESFSGSGMLMACELTTQKSRVSTFAITLPSISLCSGGFWDYYSSITKVVFEDEMIVHDTTENLIFDVSELQDGSVMSYLVENENQNNKYTLYIQANGKVIANVNSSNLFNNFSNLEEIEGLENFDTSKATNMSSMFSDCSSLTTLDLSNFDTSKATNMSSMFNGCSSLTTLDLSNFDTSNVTDMKFMFCVCRSLTTLDLSNFNTSKVTDMEFMFNVCSSLTTLDLSNFNTSNVTDMESMFYSCSALTILDVSNFDTSQVTNMCRMFRSCSTLTTLDLSPFDTSKVTNMSYMFSLCSSLTTLDLSSFDTSNVTDMSNMFSQSSSLTTLDLSSFGTSNVTNMRDMFLECSSLVTLDLSNFYSNSDVDMYMTFRGCSNLTNLNMSKFDFSKVTSTVNTFFETPEDAIVKVKDKTAQDWILALTGGYNRPSAWTTDNVIIAS